MRKAGCVRVLLVSPAAHTGGAGVLGGVAGYVADLARALHGCGCTVAVVNAGHVYRPGVLGKLGGPSRCQWEELDPFEGVKRYQLVNSAVLAPSLWQFGGPEDEAANAGIERAFAGVCRTFLPDVVHVHGFEGFCASIVDVSVRKGARVMFSVHNQHAWCPQVYLLHGRRTPCIDYDGGLRCECCEGGIDRNRERRRRAGLGGDVPALEPPDRSPPIAFEANGEPTAATRALLSYEHELWKPLGDDALPDSKTAGVVRGRYGARRRAFVSALNRCAAVLGVSESSAAISRRMGVREELVRVVPIGSWAADVPRESRPRSPAIGSALTIAFLGFGAYPKGLGVLCDALMLLTPEYQRRIRIAAHGTGVAEDMRRLDASQGGFAGVTRGGRYERGDIVSLLDGVHAVVVPSVWHDNGPQTAIEARALGVPVIGSRIGGIPDIVRDGVDGVLFRANDRVDLARVLASACRDPSRFLDLRETVRPWFSMASHAEVLVGLYASALSSSIGSSGEMERP